MPKHSATPNPTGTLTLAPLHTLLTTRTPSQNSQQLQQPQFLGSETSNDTRIWYNILKFKVNNKFITHKLQHTLYIPEAPNCLLSASRFDETGGKVIIQKGKCSLEDKNTVGHGILQRQLYLMDAETVYPAKANFASAMKKT